MIPALRRFAWKAWSTNGEPQLVDAAERSVLEPLFLNGVLVQDEKGARFADDAVLVAQAGEFVLENEESTLLSGPKACFQRLEELWRNDIGKAHTLCGFVLAALHNRGRFDAWSWAHQAIQESIQPYDVLHALEEGVPHFEHADPASIYLFFAGQYEKANVAAGLIYSRLQKWLIEHSAVASEIKRRYEAQAVEKGSSLYACALHGLAMSDFGSGAAAILAAAGSGDLLICRPAVHVLGLLDYADPAHRGPLDEAIRVCTELVRDSAHPLAETAIEVLGRLVVFDEARIVPVLDEAGKTHRPPVLSALSIFLYRDEKSHGTKTWFWPLVMHLTKTRDTNEGRFGHVDMMLSNWTRDDIRVPRALQFLDAWVANQPIEVLAKKGIEDTFPTTLHRFVERPEIFSSALTAWFLHDDERFPLVAHKIVGHLQIAKVNNLTFNKGILDGLSKDELKLLVRRMLGYCSNKDILLPLTFSLLSTKNARERTAGLVAGVLLDRVGYDYPGHTIDFLKNRLAADESEEVKLFCGQIMNKLEARLASLKALPNLKEFHPPSAKVLRFAKERHRQVNEAFEEVSKKSIWRQIVTEVRLKGGLRTFQHLQDRYTPPMELKPHSQFMTIPRSGISDPLGAERQRLSFRRATKETP